MLGATILPKYFSAAANSGIHALSYNSDSRSSKEDGGRGTGKTRKFKKVPFQKDKHCVTGQKILLIPMPKLLHWILNISMLFQGICFHQLLDFNELEIFSRYILKLKLLKEDVFRTDSLNFVLESFKRSQDQGVKRAT